MKKLHTVCLFLIIILLSCGGGGGGSGDSTPKGTTLEPPFNDPFDYFKAVCRHKALIASIIYEEAGYQTRLMYGPGYMESGYHIQAQVLINGEWFWINTSELFISLDTAHEDFDPKKEYTTDQVYENLVGGVWY